MKQHIRPWTIDLDAYPELLRERIADFCGSLLSVVFGLESVMRQFHPPRIIEIQKALRPFEDRLKIAERLFFDAVNRFGSDAVTEQLQEATERTKRCVDYIMGINQPQTAIENFLKSMRQHYRSQECLYPLVAGLKPVGRYLLEAPVRDRVTEFNPLPDNPCRTGLFLDPNSGTTLYVPETYNGQSDWPLVVALHGGSSTGRDFVWLWLREARSRRFLLLAPSSIDRTWSFDGSADADNISSMMDTVAGEWRVDRNRMLLTGLSDGAIYTLIWGLKKESPFSALAPVSGVLHPVDLSRAAEKRIYLVHGTLDWMFSVQYAHQAVAMLKEANADIQFREIEDLSHTYPRDENGAILSWFDYSLSM